MGKIIGLIPEAKAPEPEPVNAPVAEEMPEPVNAQAKPKKK